MWWGVSFVPLAHVPAREVTRLEIPPGRSHPGGERLSLALGRRRSPGRSSRVTRRPQSAGQGVGWPTLGGPRSTVGCKKKGSEEDRLWLC